MSDFNKELDTTIANAKATVVEGKRLAELCEKASAAREEWEKANGIDADKRKRFFAALSPADRKKVEEEEERFARDLAHELAAAEAKPAAGRGRKRDYV